ncbi:MAG: class I lanthipeptide [Hyphomicrobiales bacterium]
MKKKSLLLKKETIALLNQFELKQLHGGNIPMTWTMHRTEECDDTNRCPSINMFCMEQSGHSMCTSNHPICDDNF